MSVTLGVLIHVYIERKTANREWKSDATVKSNRSTLNCLLRQVTSIYGIDPPLEEIASPLLFTAVERQWPKKGENSGYATQYNKVKSLIKWANRRGYKLGDVEGFLSNVETPPDIKKHYTDREEVEMTTRILLNEGEYRNARMVQFHFESMRRGGELADMKVGDVDFTATPDAPHGEYWYTAHKTDRGRQRVVLTESEAEILKVWLAEYEELLGEPLRPEYFLFPSREPVGLGHYGGRRALRILPHRQISDHSRIFASAWKAAGVYKVGKAGHANRRGRMTEAYNALDEAGEANPIDLIMPRSGHTSPDVARAYIDKGAQKGKSDKALMALDAARRGTPIQQLQQERLTNAGQEAPQSPPVEASNVVSFEALRRRRNVG